MKNHRNTLRFKKGDLVIVRPDFQWRRINLSWGPSIVGHTTLMSSELIPSRPFLVLQDAIEAPRRPGNRKIYVEVMTEEGPRVVWAAVFKMCSK